LSYRAWPGTFRPEQVGLTPMAFLQYFGRQMPGGGIGEMVDKSDNPAEVLHSEITGKLEINCLACHSGSPAEDMSGASGYALQVIRGNYRWAATASCEFGYVTGSTKDLTEDYDFRAPFISGDSKAKPPFVEYNKAVFGHNDWVFFDVRLQILNQRCYYCHSNVDLIGGKTEKWFSDEDVHLAAGISCVDCHRNGLQHNIIRGYATEPCDSNNMLAASSSCEGCHLGKSSVKPIAGRFAAPVPEHKGIPPTHLEKISCTACHSGPWPDSETIRTKTSMAHALGVAGAKRGDVLPHILYPVFAKGEDGKITINKLFWPTYWAAMDDNNVTPLDIDTVKSATAKGIRKESLSKTVDWPSLKEEDIAKVLILLASKVSAGAKPVYIAGGQLYSLDDSGRILSAEHKAAAPYMWPIAHDVRPAAQSLGVRKCEDCHSPDAPFLFGKVPVDSPVEGKGGAFKRMKDMYEFVGPVYVRVNWFFKWLIIVVMALLIMHIMGDLYRRAILWLTKRAK